MGNSILNTLTAKSLVLISINILQPCRKDVIAESLKGKVEPILLDNSLTQLLREKRVAYEKDYYRITRIGMDSIISGKGRILRDLQRMEYLSDSIKKGGAI